METTAEPGSNGSGAGQGSPPWVQHGTATWRGGIARWGRGRDGERKGSGVDGPENQSCEETPGEPILRYSYKEIVMTIESTYGKAREQLKTLLDRAIDDR